MSMEYLWNKAYRGYRGDPTAVAQELEKIQEENGAISANHVLEKARPEKSVLHPYFEWNDTIAAEMYRLDQARLLIRMISVEIVTETQKEPLVTRAYVEMKTDEGSYQSITKVVQDNNLSRLLLEQALRELETFEHKYAVLKEVVALLEPVKQKIIELKGK